MRQERFLTKGSFFVHSSHQRIARFRERRRRERRKIGDLREILRQIYPKMRLQGSVFSNLRKYTQFIILASSLYKSLHQVLAMRFTFPRFRLLVFLFLQSKSVRCCEVQSCRVLNARLAPTNVGSYVPKRCVLITPREIFCYPQTKSNSMSRAPEARAIRNQASLH